MQVLVVPLFRHPHDSTAHDDADRPSPCLLAIYLLVGHFLQPKLPPPFGIGMENFRHPLRMLPRAPGYLHCNKTTRLESILPHQLGSRYPHLKTMELSEIVNTKNGFKLWKNQRCNQ